MNVLLHPSVEPFVVRPYQEAAKAAYLRHTGPKGGMLVMATGTGKTATAHYIATDWLARGQRVVWLAHREELLKQPLKALHRWWPQYSGGIVQAGKNNPGAQIVYASKDTLRNPKRMEEVLSYGYPDLLIVDEGHHSPSPTYSKVIAKLRGPNTRMLGLTATPDREDTKKLNDHWEVSFSYTILDALNDGALIPPYAAVAMVPDLDLSKVGGRRDYIEAELGVALLKAHIVDHTVAAMDATHLALRLPFRDHQAFLTARGQGCLVFTATVEQAVLTAAALRDDGWSAAHISGETPSGERDHLLRSFERGELDVLCNAVVLTEGTDLPRASVVVVARPTKSWSLYVQMLGRALRPFGEQERALVIDLVGATDLHSIIAAPVLVDGIDCNDSPDGAHRYLQVDGTNEGRCQHCERIIRCFKRLGGHRFVGNTCVSCGGIQCKDSDDGHHSFIPWEVVKRKCLHCGLEIRDPHAGIAGRKKGAREPIAWKSLYQEGTPVYAAHLGKHHGILFNVQAAPGMWRPFWHMGGKLHPLSPEAVKGELSAALLDDVARRATKNVGMYGGRESERQYAKAYEEAHIVARKHRIWRMR